MYHAWHGVQLDPQSDPYELPDLGQAGRDVVKLWMVATFGQSKPITKWPPELLKGYAKDHAEKLDHKLYSAKKIRAKVLLKYPLMALWGEPQNGRVRTWADLMHDESAVMVSTMVDLMRDHAIPSLAVHDSLIVARSAISTATAVLKRRFRSIAHQEVQLTYSPKSLNRHL